MKGRFIKSQIIRCGSEVLLGAGKELGLNCAVTASELLNIQKEINETYRYHLVISSSASLNNSQVFFIPNLIQRFIL